METNIILRLMIVFSSVCRQASAQHHHRENLVIVVSKIILRLMIVFSSVCRQASAQHHHRENVIIVVSKVILRLMIVFSNVCRHLHNTITGKRDRRCIESNFTPDDRI
ncbi:hypothetical protein SAMN05661012_04690 [Chitinophaga sancti]|nr:hypothetical protein SAMN05661012_04690 [Chitinophaga sancti]